MSGCSLLPVGPCALGYAWVPWLEALSPYSWVSTHLLGHRRGLCPPGTLISSSHRAGVTSTQMACDVAGQAGDWGVRLSQEGRRDVWGSWGLPGGTRPGSASPLGPSSGELRDWLVAELQFQTRSWWCRVLL